MADHLEMTVVHQTIDVPFVSREEIVDADDVISIFQQPFAEMGAEKTASTGDKNVFTAHNIPPFPSISQFWNERKYSINFRLRQEILKNIVGKKWNDIDKIADWWYLIYLLLFPERENRAGSKGRTGKQNEGAKKIMAMELSYLLITPYSLKKSRTGGIIARLLSRTDLELVAARMITPDKAFAEAYADSLKRLVGSRDEFAAKILSDYVLDNFSPLSDGRRERLMLLLFRGENACEKLYHVVGQLPSSKNRHENIYGDTIRDTYCNLVFNRDGSLLYFEPAVFTPPHLEGCIERLKIIADFIEHEDNIVDNIVRNEDEHGRERTLVIIKPDNWRRPSMKPGNIIDMFSRTCLRIVGCKIYQMSVAEALEFYGPVKQALRKKLAPVIGKKAKELLENQYKIVMGDECDAMLEKSVGLAFADDQFNRIVEFMSGVRPDSCPPEELNAPGKVKCMILIYEGSDAISKIRTVLGPTDPTKAPDGTIRREFGQDVMVNTAHASDSPESYERESKVIKIERNNMAAIIRDYLKNFK